MDTTWMNPETLQILGASSAAALIAMVVLMWRFERMLSMTLKEAAAARLDAGAARDAFLLAIKNESSDNRAFLINHMSPMTVTLNELCAGMKGLSAIISDCANRPRRK